MVNLSYRTHFVETLHLAVPMVLGQVSQIIIMASDNVMVGQYSASALAAAAFANGIVLTVMLVGIGISVGLTPLIAESAAQSRVQVCGRLLRHAFWLYTAVGIFLVALLWLMSLFLGYTGQDAEVVELGTPFFRIVSFSVLPVMISQVFKQFMEGLSSAKEPMIIYLTSAMLNVFLNYVLIWGHFGFPEMGLVGAGWATLLARIFNAAAMIFVFYWRKNKFGEYAKELHLLEFSSKIFIDLLKIGIPIGLQLLFEAGAFTFSTVMAGWLGASPLASHQIVLTISSVTFLVALGLGSAASVRTANYLGLQNAPEMRKAGFVAIFIVLLYMSFCALILVVFNAELPLLFVKANETEIITLSAGLLLIAAIYQISDGVQVVVMGALRGIQDVRIPTVIALFAYWGIGIPTGYVLGVQFGMGAAGIWYGLAIALTAAGGLLTFRFAQKSNRLK